MTLPGSLATAGLDLKTPGLSMLDTISWIHASGQQIRIAVVVLVGDKLPGKASQPVYNSATKQPGETGRIKQLFEPFITLGHHLTVDITEKLV